MNVVDDPNATARLDAAVAVGRGQAHLVVVSARGVDVVPLREAAGEAGVVVGRGEDCDVVVDAAGLSRAHARFALKHNVVVVTDLSSKNGTQLLSKGGARALPGGVEVGVGAGDELLLGSVRVLVAGPEPRRGLLPHERFAALIDDELVRARLFRRPLSLALLEMDDVAAAAGPLALTLRPIDRAGLYGKGVVEVLLPEADAAGAAHLLRGLLQMLPAARHGVATFPVSSTSAAGLWSRALRGLRGRRGPGDAQRAGDDARGVNASANTSDNSSDNASGSGDVIAVAPAMIEVLATSTRLARSRIAVLLHGETGSGKEVVARALHGPSSSARPFVAVNCGALPASLVESTLFGHEKGAFTGADSQKKGAFEQAHGGTLFLDEVAELPAAAQAALLRVLETRQVRRVGGSVDVDVDVRLVSASHQDLPALVVAGRFRSDLLFRLNAFVVELPPLRERRADIAPLARSFARQIGARDQRALSLDDDVLAALEGWPWPGNVRELRNVVERAALLSDDGVIGLQHLPAGLGAPRPALPTTAATTTAGLDDVDDPTLPLPERLERIEAHLLQATLTACGDDTARAAVVLGLPRRTLQHRLKILGVR